MSADLRIVTWNIQSGRTAVGDRVDLDLVLEMLAQLDADVVALQEVDRGQPRSHLVDQAGLLGAQLGLYVTFGPAVVGDMGARGLRLGPRARWGSAPSPTGAAYGVALLTRCEPTATRLLPLPRTPREEPRVALIVDLMAGSESLRVACTHLGTVPGVNAWQLRRLANQLGRRSHRTSSPFRLPPAPGGVLLVGDLNLPGPMVRSAIGLRWRSLVHGPTFPNPVPRRRLDYVLGSTAGPVRVRARSVAVLTSEASDHCAIAVDVRLERRRGRRHGAQA